MVKKDLQEQKNKKKNQKEEVEQYSLQLTIAYQVEEGYIVRWPKDYSDLSGRQPRSKNSSQLQHLFSSELGKKGFL